MKTCIGSFCASVTAVAIGMAAAVSAQEQKPAKPQENQPQAQTADVETVKLRALEENPERYLGKRVRLSGEVEDVLGPRVFKIDEANWADLDPELLVVMEAPLAALVKEDDRVTVTGTLRPFVDVRLDREWGWIELEPELEARIKRRPVLVANSIVGSDPEVGMFFSVTPADRAGQPTPRTTGTTGTAGAMRGGDRRPPLTDVAELAKGADHTLIGRQVNLSSVRVDRAVKAGGFWVSAGGDHLFVLPADDKTKVNAGQTVSIEGYVLRLPEQMEARLEEGKKVGNEEIYVYASSIR